ncbi:Hypothetical protein NTJ_00349 [Nesidiocoris tenuis]|uniref:DUS-like FMN-binding domain-containing protein n=1 Tax=Nesidiocoris tenuis TaxID=355587 RepID=A0ABN7A8F5_9HEMI|nr:Hypothetical protein NTJ_00349 [Nesidiocoris tenuis]
MFTSASPKAAGSSRADTIERRPVRLVITPMINCSAAHNPQPNSSPRPRPASNICLLRILIRLLLRWNDFPSFPSMV